MGELLGALGLAWPRLLLYPGGLFALGASWLLAGWLGWCAGSPTPTRPAAGLLDALPALAALTLLPLAPARVFPYGLDLALAVGLLEWPRLWRAGLQGMPRAALLRAYGPLLAGALLMAEAAGGLGLSGLLTWPATWPDQALLIIGMATWLFALPRLLEGASWALAERLRALGLLLVGTLPLVGALANFVSDTLPGDRAAWLVPPTAMVGTGILLGGLVRSRRVRCPR